MSLKNGFRHISLKQIFKKVGWEIIPALLTIQN